VVGETGALGGPRLRGSQRRVLFMKPGQTPNSGLLGQSQSMGDLISRCSRGPFRRNPIYQHHGGFRNQGRHRRDGTDLEKAYRYIGEKKYAHARQAITRARRRLNVIRGVSQQTGSQ